MRAIAESTSSPEYPPEPPPPVEAAMGNSITAAQQQKNPTVLLIQKYTSLIRGDDAHLGIGREYIVNLWRKIGSPMKRHNSVHPLAETGSPLVAIRAMIADRSLLIQTLYGTQAAAVIPVAEMQGLQSEVQNIMAWSTLALLSIACKGPAGIDIPGPAQFGHGSLVMTRKVRNGELILAFWSAATESSNSHTGIHFVIDAHNEWIHAVVDPTLRIGEIDHLIIGESDTFKGAQLSVEKLEGTLKFFSAVAMKGDGTFGLLHLSATSESAARQVVKSVLNTTTYELFDGHINPLGRLVPLTMGPVGDVRLQRQTGSAS